MVIEQLLKTCANVTIALNCDRPYESILPDDFSLFRMTAETYATIVEIARVNGILIEDNTVFEEQQRFNHPSLAYLEKNFEQVPAIPYEGETNIYFAEAANLRAEIEGIGGKIKSLVRDHGYRYKDIAILVRNGENYQDLFDTIFSDFEIPYHIDQKRSMLNHPVIELIRSSLEIITNYWRYDPIFRAVKTDLLFPLDGNIQELRERMDRLENYCLAYGVQGEKWTKKRQVAISEISGT